MRRSSISMEAKLDDIVFAKLTNDREMRTAYDNAFKFVAAYVKDKTHLHL